MNQTAHLLSLPVGYQDALQQVLSALAGAGFEARRSFDLQVARAAHTDCTCPYHGTERCTCQMVILLVYEGGRQIANLIVHSRDDHTEIGLAKPYNPHDKLHLRRILLTAVYPRAPEIFLKESSSWEVS